MSAAYTYGSTPTLLNSIGMQQIPNGYTHGSGVLNLGTTLAGQVAAQLTTENAAVSASAPLVFMLSMPSAVSPGVNNYSNKTIFTATAFDATAGTLSGLTVVENTTDRDYAVGSAFFFSASAGMIRTALANSFASMTAVALLVQQIGNLTVPLTESEVTGLVADLGAKVSGVNGSLTTPAINSPTFSGALLTAGAAPAIAAGAAAGAGATVAVAGNDTAGTITITTGALPTANGVLATITFNQQTAAAWKNVILTPGTNTLGFLSTNAPVGVDLAHPSTTGFTLKVGGNALLPNTAYVYGYLRMG